jgi:Tol biopolymer transport system component/DNA-binding winged helix-turn-helix (wHTH) protein
MKAMSEKASGRARFGPFLADLDTHELRKDGTKVKLVGQPFDILALLLSRPGELVTREELRSELWPGDTFVDFNHGLNAAVNKLREALCDSVENPRFVETLPRRGYRFVAGVERLAREPALPAPSAASADELRAAEPAGPRARASGWYLAAAGALVALLVGTLLLKITASRAVLEPRPGSMRFLPFTGEMDSGEPSFSPDGATLAFAHAGPSVAESGIFAKPIGGSGQKQLTAGRWDRSPVWSPDGQTIAFTRRDNQEFRLYLVPVGGGAERRVDAPGLSVRRKEIDWSPDGRSIGFTARSGIAFVSLDTLEIRRLTSPPPGSEDWGPSFSRDANRVLFVRSRGTGFPEQVIAVSLAGGEETVMASAAAELQGPARWSADERSVIFSAYLSGRPGLWRVSAEKRDAAVQVNESGAYPAVARRGNRLAYERPTHGLNIWQLELGASKAEESVLVPLTSQTDQGPGPQFSPDGRRLAYMSDRSGTMEIWVSDRDGKNPRQLTSTGNAGTPRWSPDSQTVVFDAPGRQRSQIYLVNLNGAAARLLTEDEFENRCPSFSPDGKWIYFASTRTGRWEVWKIPAGGGATVQLTRLGGHAPLPSPDGRSVYYAKTPYAYPEIWTVPVSGGAERLLSRKVRPATWASWAAVDRGILFAGPSGNGGPVVNFFDPSSRLVKTVGSLEVVPFWLGATSDGKTIAFDKPGWQQSQIMLVENFR